MGCGHKKRNRQTEMETEIKRSRDKEKGRQINRKKHTETEIKRDTDQSQRYGKFF
jgi:hypothetical protein